MFGENPRAVPLFRGDYNNKEEPTEWFAQFELSLPMSWSDSQRIERFEMQLAPGNVAEEWFQEIATFKTLTFTSLKLAFRRRWPPPKRTRFTRAQQKERVMAELLDESEIGLWKESNYGHNVWANKIARLALGMGDTEGFLIEYVMEGIPNLLKDHLKCEYRDWDDFIEDVQSVPSIKLKRGREDLTKERTRDADIAQLKAQNTPSMIALQQQFAQMSTGPQRLSVPAYRTRAPMTLNPTVTNYSSSLPTTSPVPFTTPMRGTFGMRGTPFSRV
jgi:hypothetical protein